MADKTTVKQSESKFRAPSPGNKVTQCVDVLNFGECVSDFPGKPKELGPKIGLVFRTGEVNPTTGELIDVVAEYGAYMSPKAKLRQLLEGWRGKPFKEDDTKEGIPLDKLCGKYVLLNIGNKTNAAGTRTYAVVLSASPVPKEMKIPVFAAYERPQYLEDRKAKYAADTALYRAEIGVDEDGNPLGHPDDDGHDEEDVFAEPGLVAGALPKRVQASESGGKGLLPDPMTSDDLPF